LPAYGEGADLLESTAEDLCHKPRGNVSSGAMEGTGCGVLVLVLLAVIVVFFINQASQRARARSSYEESLSQLKADPANPDLRGETLRLGRVYSNLTRNGKGVTIFDEVALSNDINAACARASGIRVSAQLPSVETRLEHLATLRHKGLIDDAEYAERRREILKQV
jgi:hypothetical protein